MDDQLIYKIGITKIPLVGSINAKTLISYCGGVRAVFESSKKELLRIPGIGEMTAKSITKQTVLLDAEREAAFIEQHDIQTFFYLDDNYPQRLKVYEDCPILLYYKGNADLNHHRNVAIVGTRKPSPHGRINCDQLIKDLVDYDVQIISGLAFGIDVTAHKRCLDLNIPTVGVMGTGLGMIYPVQHKSVAYQMCENGGLLTEYPSSTTPEREHFPMRNRIIAGLCDALVVVETAASGGSIISANIAHAYNKDVFAIPGRLNDTYSQGCNRLIKTHKASLLECAEDLAYNMRWDQLDKKKATVQKQLFVDLSEEEKIVLNVLKEVDTIGIDKLSHSLQLTPSSMAGILLEMEFKGLIRNLPGKQYMMV